MDDGYSLSILQINRQPVVLLFVVISTIFIISINVEASKEGSN
jgi:hypothetical protein